MSLHSSTGANKASNLEGGKASKCSLAHTMLAPWKESYDKPRQCTMWETRIQSLGREDPLEKEMATHSSILAWKIPRTEKPGRLQSWTRLSDFTFTFRQCIKNERHHFASKGPYSQSHVFSSHHVQM